MIYTFYSYKGGAGRTHLLANIASYLCYYKKRKILLIDWDLEAPGLHYYFGKTEADLQNTKGLIDLCEYYTLQVSKATAENPLEEKDLFFPNEEYIYNLIKAKNGGKIDLLPATQYINGYQSHINQFDWINFYDTQKGSIYLAWLKEKLKLKSKYDYVFIDSRTGQNDYSGICNVLMPDMNVLVVAPNMQNFEGAKKMTDRIINSKYVKDEKRKPYILPILSKLDEYNIQEGEKWKNKFVDTFKFCMPLLDKDLENFSQEVTDIILEHTYQKYNPSFALGENAHFEEEATILRETHPLKKLENIALDFIEEMNETGKINLNKVVGDRMKLVYKRRVNEKPNDFDAWFNLGNVYLNEKHYQEAERNYIKAINIKKDFYEALNNLGVIYINKKNYEKAIETYQKAIQINPTYEYAWNGLGNIYYEKKNYKKAIEAYQKTIEINPNFEYAWDGLGNIYNNIEIHEKAIEAYQKAIEINPNFEYAWMGLGNVCIKKKQYQKATEAYQKVIEINPFYADALNGLGIIYKNLKNYNEAEKSFIEALQLDENFEEAWTNLGMTYYQKQNYDKAIKSYQKAIEINPNFEDAWNCLGIINYQQEHYEEAKKYYLKALEINPNFIPAFSNLGWLYFLEGNLQEAKTCFEKSVSQPQSIINLGHIALVEKQENKAMELYQQSFEAFEDKNIFFEEMEEDTQHLEKQGIDKEKYQSIIAKFKQNI